MAYRFMCFTMEPPKDDQYEVQESDVLFLEGDDLIDRVLEGITLRLSKTPEGDLVLSTTSAKDQGYIDEMCISMESLLKKTKEYIGPQEDVFYVMRGDKFHEAFVWDDTIPLPDDIVFVDTGNKTMP